MTTLEVLFKEKGRIWLTEEEMSELNLVKNEDRQAALFFHPDPTLYWKEVYKTEHEWVEANLPTWMYT